MNIHEYQAKAVLKEFGVPVPRGVPAFTVDEAKAHATAKAKTAGTVLTDAELDGVAGGFLIYPARLIPGFCVP